MDDLDENLPMHEADSPVADVGLPDAGAEPDDLLAAEATEDNADAPADEDTVASENNSEKAAADDDDNVSDNESLLSDVDEAQFQDFDPAAISLEDRQQIAIDDENVKLLGVHKRKRAEGEGDDATRKKKKERRRDRSEKKRARRRREAGEEYVRGDDVEGGRKRRRADDGEGGSHRRRDEVDESTLTPEERKRRELDRRMDEALKSGKTRISKKDGIDLEQAADEEVSRMARRMAEAARLDSEARQRHEPAMAKLQLLPEVTALLNRGGAIQESIVDPENDLLRSITFFLEPSAPDGALPAYAIQKALFDVLPRLPIGAEELRGDTKLGQCVLFYTKSKKPEPNIKRAAERLLTKWMSLMLKRPNDYRNRDLSVNQGPTIPVRTGRQTAEELARERALQDPTYANRARIQGGLSTYTIAPKPNAVEGGGRPIASKSDAAFRKIQARSQGARR
ncbi:uncharacterized protein PV09_09221 [Verruconis gallopava]|uniref:TFIIS N-terminal domain-containing protein n=1 Tax=Verruconis gallopava TaxID=253628 RepID=A0A0D2AJG1_9PEZI|nr:uncharacterized protein PV09_09221 [Verruconis gallopava]KIV99048.1 hypothetical protein PV09_09221 [Verruconis gallopava]